MFGAGEWKDWVGGSVGGFVFEREDGRTGWVGM